MTRTSVLFRDGSVPFFFEPNLDAIVRPMPAAVRLQEKVGVKVDDRAYPPISYEQYIRAKVGSNYTAVAPMSA